MADKFYVPCDFGRLDDPCGTLCVDLGDGNGPQPYTGGEIVVNGALRYGVTWYFGVYVRDDAGEFVPFSLTVGELKDVKSESSCDWLYAMAKTNESDENGRCVVHFGTNMNNTGDVVATIPMSWKLSDGTECDQDVTFRFPALECVPVEYWWYEETYCSIECHGCRDGWTPCEDPFTPLGVKPYEVSIPNIPDDPYYGAIVRYALPDDVGSVIVGMYDSAGVYINRSVPALVSLGDGTYLMLILKGLTRTREITYASLCSNDFSKTAEVMDISGEDTFATYACMGNCPNQQFASTLNENDGGTGGVTDF